MDNIVLSEDMRANVTDFGLVRDCTNGKASHARKVVGTFGYIAPEYAVSFQVTTKIDVFSFGVILMELMMGRKAIQQDGEDRVHLAQWFQQMLKSEGILMIAIDLTLDLDIEGLEIMNIVVQLAVCCCVRNPNLRPDMSHAVVVLSSQVE
ncbi:receptor protein kinase TMK1-like [Rutidosis leptorrhynchoides]|uniref:receptor protein kinase TMK1-like n=1 Tax=Rutidosis leptorrhynchoides TaxID=125765 RepID=UPI003A9A6337